MSRFQFATYNLVIQTRPYCGSISSCANRPACWYYLLILGLSPILLEAMAISVATAVVPGNVAVSSSSSVHSQIKFCHLSSLQFPNELRALTIRNRRLLSKLGPRTLPLVITLDFQLICEKRKEVMNILLDFVCGFYELESIGCSVWCSWIIFVKFSIISRVW